MQYSHSAWFLDGRTSTLVLFEIIFMYLEVGLSNSGNFLITIVRTLLFMIVNSIMIVGLLVY